MIRSSPSTSSVSFPNALTLSLVRPLAMFAFARSRPWHPSCFELLVDRGEELVDVDPRVPEVEGVHDGEPPDALAVCPDDLTVDRLPLLRVEASVAARDREAGDESLDVPLERPRERLVEVVDAEHHPPVGRGVATEVRQVGVAAELRVEPRSRPAREIRGHQVRRTAVEGERRDEHPAVADRDELGHPRLRLLLQQLHRIRSVQRRLPLPVRRARHLGACGLATGSPFADREVLDLGAGGGALRRRHSSSPFSWWSVSGTIVESPSVELICQPFPLVMVPQRQVDHLMDSITRSRNGWPWPGLACISFSSGRCAFPPAWRARIGPPYAPPERNLRPPVRGGPRLRGAWTREQGCTRPTRGRPQSR